MSLMYGGMSTAESHAAAEPPRYDLGCVCGRQKAAVELPHSRVRCGRREVRKFVHNCASHTAKLEMKVSPEHT